MVYHTFVSGEVLTAANVMNDLMNQSVIVCTSGSRPASPVVGMTVYETDTNLYSSYTGTTWVSFADGANSVLAWTDYSGSVSLIGTGATIGNGSIFARYKRIGKTVHAQFRVTGGSTSTWGSGNASLRGLFPVTQANASADDVILGIRHTQSTSAAAWVSFTNNAGTDCTLYLNGSSTAETGTFSGLVYQARFTFEAA